MTLVKKFSLQKSGISHFFIFYYGILINKVRKTLLLIKVLKTHILILENLFLDLEKLILRCDLSDRAWFCVFHLDLKQIRVKGQAPKVPLKAFNLPLTRVKKN